LVRAVQQLWVKLLPLQLVMMMMAAGIVAGVTGAMIIVLARGNIPVNSSTNIPAEAPLAPTTIAAVFTPEVQYWSPYIMRWSQEYGVDPNILATVIQIESCGDFQVGSPAGAQGLFQVMPFHFEEGEDMHDPDTNALRGINYLKGGLELADGHIGLAMAGYNGGWGVINRGWAGWYRETRLYYVWGSQIYMDALNGKRPEESESLQSWLNAGGVNLCRQAHGRLFGTPTPFASQMPAAQPTVQLFPLQ
jgi:soluble lytic murein transglycosylase-like protein